MRGYLLPHPPVLLDQIGNGRQFGAKKTLEGYMKVREEIEAYQPDITVVITPHGPLFRDGIAIYDTQPLEGDFRNFGSPNIMAGFENDEALAAAIAKALESNLDMPAVFIDDESALGYHVSSRLDHGSLVPLMLSGVMSPVVVLNYGLLNYVELYRAGKEIGKLLSAYERPLMIASGDLSHKLKDDGPYNFDPSGPVFDAWLIDAFSRGDLLAIASASEKEIESAGECGMRSIQMLLGAFDGYSVETDVISYEGPFGVGYGIVRFVSGESRASILPDLSAEKKRLKSERTARHSDPVKLAFAVIEKAVTQGEHIAIHDDYEAFDGIGSDRKGVFVSIKDRSGLRGCIGTFLPTEKSVRYEIIRNAIEASLHDPRFLPITPRELDDLIVSVDYLSEPEDITSKEELDPIRYGVIVRNGNRRGLLLPNLEGVNSVEEQLRIAKRKAGISSGEAIELQRFEVIRYE